LDARISVCRFDICSCQVNIFVWMRYSGVVQMLTKILKLTDLEIKTILGFLKVSIRDHIQKKNLIKIHLLN